MNVKETIDLVERLKAQRERIRRGEFRHVGMCEAISFDMEKGQRVPAEQLAVVGRAILFKEKRRPLALSLDDQDLLLPYGLPKKLADVMDPKFPGRSHISERIPMVPQVYADCASFETDILGKHWIGFQPVQTITLLNDMSVLDKRSQFPRIRCAADTTGRHMVLLICPEGGKDRDTSEAYLIGGRFQFSVALSRSEPFVGQPAYAMA